MCIGSINLSNLYFQAILSNVKNQKNYFSKKGQFFKPNLLAPNKIDA